MSLTRGTHRLHGKANGEIDESARVSVPAKVKKARQPALRHVIGSCEALIHHAPERSDGLGLVIEEILEEAGFAEGGWIGVSFPVVATFFNPVVRFTRIDTGE